MNDHGEDVRLVKLEGSDSTLLKLTVREQLVADYRQQNVLSATELI